MNEEKIKKQTNIDFDMGRFDPRYSCRFLGHAF